MLIGCVGCRPDGILSKSEMQALLYDMHRADGVLTEAGYNYGHNDDLDKFYGLILEKHGISKSQLDSSLAWYTAHPQRFEHIYPKVIEQLTHEMEQAQAITMTRHDDIEPITEEELQKMLQKWQFEWKYEVFLKKNDEKFVYVLKK